MARIAVVGDIHGNLPALQVVVANAADVDHWWCIGDTVGYGPFPAECVRMLRALDTSTVAGNHDLGCTGGIDLAHFNPDARKACRWTASALDAEARSYLGSLPLKASIGDALLVHGSPRDPVWEYVLSPQVALRSVGTFEETVCFNGHSHVPAVFSWPRKEVEADVVGLSIDYPGEDEVVRLEPGRHYLINVGSVGQPRDRDPRACFVTYSSEDREVAYHRVAYDVAETREKMREAGLPRFLAERLQTGM